MLTRTDVFKAFMRDPAKLLVLLTLFKVLIVVRDVVADCSVGVDENGDSQHDVDGRPAEDEPHPNQRERKLDWHPVELLKSPHADAAVEGVHHTMHRSISIVLGRGRSLPDGFAHDHAIDRMPRLHPHAVSVEVLELTVEVFADLRTE